MSDARFMALNARAFAAFICFAIAAIVSGPGAAAQASGSQVSVTVSTSAEGAGVRQGGFVTITWRSTGAPAGATIELAAEKVLTGHVLGPLRSGLPASGSLKWRVPVYQSQAIPCARDQTGDCTGAMNPGTVYRIVATLTGRAATAGLPPFLAAARSATFKMLAAQQN